MNPYVLIVTHERKEITTANIRSLQKQTDNIIVVSSSIDEWEYYRKLNVHSLLYPNLPLGEKWQYGVKIAQMFYHLTHLIILGSDDFLSNNFLNDYCNDQFCGFKQWFVMHNSKIYHFEYLAAQPLGGGRVYPREVLNKMDWRVFDETKNRLLDDQGWNYIHSTKNFNIHFKPEILAIKGNWEMLNPFTTNHKNLKLIATYEGEEARSILKKFS